MRDADTHSPNAESLDVPPHHTLAQARMPVLVKGVKRNATCYDFGFVARICCATRTLAGESKRRTLEDTAGKLHGAALGFARNRAQERRMICGE